MAETGSALDMALVVGTKLRHVRERNGLTLDQVAVAARRRGLKWSESKVAKFERGDGLLNLLTLVALCVALEDLGCEGVTLQTLLDTENLLRVNDNLELPPEYVGWLVGGDSPHQPAPEADSSETTEGFLITSAFERSVERRQPQVNLDTLRRVQSASGETEHRMARTLRISRGLMAYVSASLWKRTFSAERDRRAPKGATAHARGRISRQLRDELEQAINVVD